MPIMKGIFFGVISNFLDINQKIGFYDLWTNIILLKIKELRFSHIGIDFALIELRKKNMSIQGGGITDKAKIMDLGGTD
ncbi:MAG: hypothetical protein PVH84_07590 [Candidatus Aminicenantes bacterium]|jgi:hypothetical protein